MELFQHTSDISSHNTHAYSNNALFITRIESSTYGKHSLRYKIPFEYNKFIRDHQSISDIHTVYAIIIFLFSFLFYLSPNTLVETVHANTYKRTYFKLPLLDMSLLA